MDIYPNATQNFDVGVARDVKIDEIEEKIYDNIEDQVK